MRTGRHISMGQFLHEATEGKVVDLDNPKCKNCNECCGILTLLTDEDYKNIGRYLFFNPKGKQVMQKAFHRVEKFLNQGTVYMMCPFSNENLRCDIYFIRPQICRQFHCKPSLNKSDKNEYSPLHHHTIADFFYTEDGPLRQKMKALIENMVTQKDVAFIETNYKKIRGSYE